MGYRFVNNFPVAGYGLNNLHAYRFILAVFQHYLKCAFKGIAISAETGQFLKISLFLVCGHIKGFTEFQANRFIFRGMVDAVFTNKLQAAGTVSFYTPA